jgi:hypothetical protein
MIVTLHLCGPEGEALRQQLANALNTVKRDNRYVINAMLNSGIDVPDTVLDLNYVPSRHSWLRGQPTQEIFGMRAMFDSGEFSCGDAAAYEAAVQEEKYGIPTEVLCVPTTSDADYHGIYVTPDDVVDPTENWLRYWEQSLGLPSEDPLPIHTSRRSAPVENLGASCEIVGGKVQCSVADAPCCVDAEAGVWRCPDPDLNGRPVKLAKIFEGKNQRWARTVDGVFVPLCKGGSWAA